MNMKDIQDHVYFKIRKAQVDAMKTVREGTLHVSDVISPCHRNVFYKKTDPNPSMDTESMRSLWFGQIVHAHSDVADKPEWNEIKLAYDWVEDKPVDLDKLMKKLKPDDPKWYDILIGSIDDLIKMEDRYVICDKKTTGSIDWFAKATAKPSESHVNQINHYRVLLNKCMGIDATHGCVIYISNTKTTKNDKPVPLAFKLDDMEVTLEKIKQNGEKIKDMMLNNKMPERTRCFLCDGMCSYAQECFDTP